MAQSRTRGANGVDRSGTGIQSVARAIDILYCLARSDGAASVTVLSTQLNLHKSTVSRLLLTLEQGRLVVRDARTGHYRLGLGLLELAGLALERFDLRTIAQPHLLKLVEACRETVSVGVLDGDESVNIAQILSPETIKHVAWIGRRNPLYCTSGGRVFLAFGPDELFQRIVARGLTALTPYTITTPAALAVELARVRQQGVAVVRDEFEVGVTALAAPIRNRQGAVIAACGITGPSSRLPAELIAERARQLLEAVASISRDLSVVDVMP